MTATIDAERQRRSRRSCCGPSTSSPSRSPRGASSTPAPASGSGSSPARRAPSRRRSTTPAPCTATPASPTPWPCTSPGTRPTTTTALLEYMKSKDLGVGGINLNTFQDADYMLGSICHPDAGGPRQGPRGAHRVLRHRRARWVPRRSRCGSATAPTTPARTTCAGAATASSRACRRPTAWLPENARMYLEYKIFEPALYSTDVQDWGQSHGRLQPRRRARGRLRRHRPPQPGREHRADRGHPPGGGQAGRLRPQRQEVRRRRPHGRLHRPVPDVPHHARAHQRHA